MPRVEHDGKYFVGIQRIERKLIVMAAEILVEWQDFEGTHDKRDCVGIENCIKCQLVSMLRYAEKSSV